MGELSSNPEGLLLLPRRWGWKPDPKDDRDRPFRQHARFGTAVLPMNASVEDSRVWVKDQVATSSCTGQAWSQAVRLSCLKRGIECPDLSALFSYFTNRAEFGEQHSDEGAYLRTGAKAAVRFGIAEESSWSFADARVNLEPGYSAFRSAAHLRGARSYHSVNLRSLLEVREALAAGFAVVGGWDVDQSFMDYDGRGIITIPDPAYLQGGHALCLTGYDISTGTFRFINSWGVGWGEAGYGVTDGGWVMSGSDGWVVDVGDVTV